MKTQQAGFTLIELIVVIVILGILAAVAVPKFVNIASDARIAAIKGVNGAMSSTNALIYAKAAVNNQVGATGTVTINGASVATVYGFAKDGLELVKAMDLSADFTSTATLISHAGATTPATCSITYAAATATTVPTYTLATAGC